MKHRVGVVAYWLLLVAILLIFPLFQALEALPEAGACAEGSSRLTLYCAIRRGSFETTGNFRHRGPALQAVREQIGVLKPNAHYEHRLSGFNADPSVTLGDVQHLLDLSIAAIRTDLRN